MSNGIEYVVGQRWLSHAEPELGLGIVLAVEGRILQLSFPAVEEERTYSIKQAPLCRITYRKNDKVETNKQLSLTIKDVQSLKGFYVYLGIDDEDNEHQILESDLSHTINFNAPLQRLLSGQVDKQKYFQLKIDTLRYLSKIQQSSTQGLIGARTQLLPHQIHIAHQVSKRSAPRVLLADEVGLGKTIEAGLILYNQWFKQPSINSSTRLPH
jgi:ATP-dependent helicase HepA